MELILIRHGRPERSEATADPHLSPLGHDWQSVRTQLRACRNAVTRIPDWAPYDFEMGSAAAGSRAPL